MIYTLFNTARTQFIPLLTGERGLVVRSAPGPQQLFPRVNLTGCHDVCAGFPVT